ncbi:hypothetical protein BJ944DRAFT_259156 [Cunninghamella echinulata]|nr:hypothetical protein BJ944DRAFT_259156 [Cunninghamella echinulata]
MSQPPSTQWNNTTNTPSPVFFPSASPTPKLSSTPSKKPPSPVDWQQDLVGEESNKVKHPGLHNVPFTFDGDITRPELDVILQKLQQSTLSADTLTSSFVEEEEEEGEGLFNDEIQDDLMNQQFCNDNTNIKSNEDFIDFPIQQHMQKKLQQESDSQQLRQWLDQLPEIEQGEQLEEILNQNSQRMKRASLVSVGKQFVTKMKKAAGSNNNNHKKTDTS